MNSKNKIKFFLNEFIAGAESSVIIGGHFALTNDPYNEKLLIPAIFQDCLNEEVSLWIKNHPYMSYFPSETFLMSLDLLKENKVARLLLLVNDWQQVKETLVSKSELRSSFYLKNELPILFSNAATKEGINLAERIFSATGNTYHNSLFWSEMILRNRFDNRASYKSCSLKNGCAQEFVPLLDSCEEVKTNKMIAMIPATCAYPILDAVNEFKNARNGKMDILTVFISNSLSLEKFWEATVFINGKQES